MEGERPREPLKHGRPLQLLALCGLFAAGSSSAAPLRLSEFFGSDMVLPCDTPFAVAGQAAPNQTVFLRVGAQPELSAQADAQGSWRAVVPASPAGAAPFELAVRAGTDSLVLTNLLFGDLWVCAGQSNMELPLRACDAAPAALAAATDPALRLLRAECRLPTGGQAWSDAQLALARSQDAFRLAWQPVTTRTAPALSGVAVLFGQALRRARPGVPLGLLQIAVGGAPAEAFLPADKAQRLGWLTRPDFPAPWCQARAALNLSRAPAAPGGADGLRHPFEPGALYDRAIAPLAALLPVAGVLWYQGESNASTCGSPDLALNPDTMRAGLTTLISSWRRAWRRDDLPFILVQLPRMNRPWMLYREQQLRVAQTLPNVGLVVATDTGHPSNVHPADKRPVAERAALEARRLAYRDPTAPAVTFAVSAAQGPTVLVRFTPGHALATPATPLQGFELSADGRTFVAACASLRPGNTVAVTADGLPSPVALRYNWSPVPPGELRNVSGLPVPPFHLKIQQRTDP